MKKLVCGLAPMLVLLNSVALAADVNIVAKAVNVQGNVVLERGNAHFALQKDMSLVEGDKVIVLENGTVDLIYDKSHCQVNHPQNTLLTVADASQCVKGMNFGMGAPSVSAGGGAAGTGTAGTGAAGAGAAGTGAAGAGAAGAGAAGTGAAGAGAAGAGAAAAGAAGAATVGGIAAAAGGLSIATVAAAAAAVAGVAAAAGGGSDNSSVSR